MRLIGYAGNGVEAVAEFRRYQPDVTLMDLQLPGSNGTDVLIAIRGEFPRARIVMLTTSDSDGEIQRAMRAGAAAYLLKSMAKDDLLAVIRSVHAGRRHVPAEVAARLAEHLGEDDLTTRELEVLSLIRDGWAIKPPLRQAAAVSPLCEARLINAPREAEKSSSAARMEASRTRRAHA